ncbi:hypothetical protein NESM_000360700 [Novymonas esmeraldas]|uniref:Uncharacterized protein n=1 Tax=Novymonas esmeraldas TaxID=1808958 RepID=A0AAW0EMN0_9TRYP
MRANNGQDGAEGAAENARDGPPPRNNADTLVCTSAAELAAVRDKGSVQCLHISEDWLIDVELLRDFTAVRQLTLQGCARLTMLSAIGFVQSLAGLDGTSALETIRATGCGTLQSLPGLETATSLTVLLLANTGIPTLKGVGRRPALQRIDASGWADLGNIAPLPPAKPLLELDFSGTGVAHISALAGSAAMQQKL